MNIATLKVNDKVTTTTRLQGTNPITGNPKMAKGKVGVVIATDLKRGFYGPIVVVRWPNGVETYHARNLPDTLELAA